MTALIGKAATGADIDKAFEAGEDMREYFDFSSGHMRASAQPTRRISMDMSESMVRDLDAIANDLAVNRQAVIKFACKAFIDEEKRKATA